MSLRKDDNCEKFLDVCRSGSCYFIDYGGCITIHLEFILRDLLESILIASLPCAGFFGRGIKLWKR